MIYILSSTFEINSNEGAAIIPMLIQKLDKYSIISALIQWIVVGVVVTHIEIGLESWLKGLVIAVLMGLPIIVLVMKTDAKSALPILMTGISVDHCCLVIRSIMGLLLGT